MSITGNWEEAIKTEIEELHEFLQNWFNGLVEESSFSRFLDAMNHEFQIISPNGKLTDLGNITEAIRKNFSQNKTIKIWVENVSVRRLANNLYLAIYNELRESNKKRTSRITTALFSKSTSAPNNIEWLHVHETWND